MESGILKRVAKNSIVVMLEKMIEIFIGIATVAVLARYLAVETFGLYTLITTFVGLLMAVGYGGMERIMIRDVARERARYLEYLQGVKGARVILVGITVIFIALFSYFLKLSGAEQLTAVFLFTLSEIASLYGSTYMALFKAFEKMEYNMLITFLSKIITLSGIITAAYLGLGFLAIFIAMLVGNIFKTALAVSMLKKSFGLQRVSFSFSRAKALLKEAYIIAVSAIFAVASIRMGVFMLKAFGTLRDVAFFQASNAVLLQFQLISIAIVSALFPVLSRRNANNDGGEGLNMIFGKAAKFIFIISLPLSVISYFFSHELINLIYGGKYGEAVPAMRILVSSMVFTFLATLFETVLISERRQHLLTAGWIAAFVVNLAANLFLAPRYGFIGSALAMFLSYFVLWSLLYFFVVKHTDIRLSPRIFIRPLLACAAMIIYLSLFSSGGNALALIDIVHIMVTLALYTAVLFLVKAFSVEEIIFMKDILRRLKSGPGRPPGIDTVRVAEEKILS